jgi:hypothetical protein
VVLNKIPFKFSPSQQVPGLHTEKKLTIVSNQYTIEIKLLASTCELMKVLHAGSNTSASAEFCQQIAKEIMI